MSEGKPLHWSERSGTGEQAETAELRENFEYIKDRIQEVLNDSSYIREDKRSYMAVEFNKAAQEFLQKIEKIKQDMEEITEK